MQVNIATREHAKYVESHVPNYIWKVGIGTSTTDVHGLQLIDETS